MLIEQADLDRWRRRQALVYFWRGPQVILARRIDTLRVKLTCFFDARNKTARHCHTRRGSRTQTTRAPPIGVNRCRLGGLTARRSTARALSLSLSLGRTRAGARRIRGVRGGPSGSSGTQARLLVSYRRRRQPPPPVRIPATQRLSLSLSETRV